jgi:hypothetical protein
VAHDRSDAWIRGELSESSEHEPNRANEHTFDRSVAAADDGVNLIQG